MVINFLKVFVNLLIFGLLVTGFDFVLDKQIMNPDNRIVYYTNSKIRDWLIVKNIDVTKINTNDYQIEKATVKHIDANEETRIKFCGEDRTETGLNNNYTKNPIIILGCSYAYGQGLERKKSLSYRLSQESKRPVLSFAYCGHNLLSSLSNFENYSKYGEYDKYKKADYVIYIYMWDHINRYLNTKLFYKYYNDLFKPTGFEKIISDTNIGRYLLSAIRLQKIFKNYPYNDSAAYVLKKVIAYCNRELKNLVPNAKFIIVLYDEKYSDLYTLDQIKFSNDIINHKIWNEIEKEEKIPVIHTKELTGVEFDNNYKLEEDISDWHPNEKAWDLIVPALIKKYNL